MLEINVDSNFKFSGPEYVFIIGNNGSGKSTFLKSFINKTSSFKIECGKNRLAYLPQTFEHFDEIAVDEFFDFMEVDSKSTYVEQFQVIPLFARKIQELSGGEKQRVYLAAVLSQNADIFLLDEPLNNLDLYWQNKFLYLSQKLSETKLVITICHDLQVIQYFAKRVIVFEAMKYNIFSIDELLREDVLQKIFNVRFKKIGTDLMVRYV